MVKTASLLLVDRVSVFSTSTTETRSERLHPMIYRQVKVTFCGRELTKRCMVGVGVQIVSGYLTTWIQTSEKRVQSGYPSR